jgi:hypothetical protein
MKTAPRSLGSSALVLCVALSLDAGACGGNEASGQAVAPDAGSSEGGADADASLDAASALDTASADSGLADGNDDDGSCGLPRTTLGAACDACVQTNCEPAWCTCAKESAAAADGGSSGDGGSADAETGVADGAAVGAGCAGYAKCVESCVAADAGSPTDCFQTVCALGVYTPTQQQGGHAFLDCLVQYCAVPCGE